MRFMWQFLSVAAVAFIGGQLLAAVDGNPWLTFVFGATTAILSLFCYRAVVRRTEGRSVTELGRDGWCAALGRGTLVGAAAFTAVIVNLALLGDFRIDGWGSPSAAIGFAGFMAAAAVTEELLFRGVLFRIAEERVGTWVALIGTSLVFGLSHLFNENASIVGALAIAIEAGGMLTAAYVATRRLWVPIGIHFGWNVAGSSIFGTEVSGNGSTAGLFESSLSGPSILTGGSFGPEASVLSVVLCVALTGAMMWVARRRGQIRPMRRRSEQDWASATLTR